MTTTYSRRKGLSILLVLSMFFSILFTVSPINEANAGVLGLVGSIAKTALVNVGALAGGAMAAVLGAAVGGGPLGMGIGAVAGYTVTKKVLNWATSDLSNFATVAGAVAGGLLCAGMGFPMLAIGVLGGGIVSRLLVKGVSALINKAKNASNKSDGVDVNYYLDNIKNRYSTTTSSTVVKSSEIKSNNGVKDSQTAYNNYIAAYEEYVKCAQKGDKTGAQAAYEKYTSNMSLYQSLLKAGL